VVNSAWPSVGEWAWSANVTLQVGVHTAWPCMWAGLSWQYIECLLAAFINVPSCQLLVVWLVPAMHQLQLCTDTCFPSYTWIIFAIISSRRCAIGNAVKIHEVAENSACDLQHSHI